jgi:hypothetical protein
LLENSGQFWPCKPTGRFGQTPKRKLTSKTRAKKGFRGQADFALPVAGTFGWNFLKNKMQTASVAASSRFLSTFTHHPVPPVRACVRCALASPRLRKCAESTQCASDKVRRKDARQRRAARMGSKGVGTFRENCLPKRPAKTTSQASTSENALGRCLFHL